RMACGGRVMMVFLVGKDTEGVGSIGLSSAASKPRRSSMDLMRGLILGICQHLLCKFQIGKRGGVCLLQFHDAHSVAVCVPHLDRVG
ncbi:hypothetical protein LPJCHP_LPJCHP_14085, partial [Dysosmobacter welbionis]